MTDQTQDAPLTIAPPPQDHAKKTFLKSRRRASKGKTSLPGPTFNEALSSSHSDFITTPTSSDSAGFPEVEGAATLTGNQGFDDDFTGFGNEDETQEGSDEDAANAGRGHSSEEEDEDEEMREDGEEVQPLQRQATTEAVQRRPLDEGSNSSTEDDDEAEAESDDSDTPSSSQQHPSPLSPTRASAAETAKKREQTILRQKWGLDDDDDDDDDSDDEPVVMGGKYLARTRTGS